MQRSISSIKSKDVPHTASLIASSSLCTNHHIQKIHWSSLSTNPFRPLAATFADASSVAIPTNLLVWIFSFTLLESHPRTSKSWLSILLLSVALSKEEKKSSGNRRNKLCLFDSLIKCVNSLAAFSWRYGLWIFTSCLASSSQILEYSTVG